MPIDLIFLAFMIIIVSAIVYRMSNFALVAVMTATVIAFGVHLSTVEPSLNFASDPRNTNFEMPKNTNFANHSQNLADLDQNLDEANHSYNDLVCPGDNMLSLRMWENGKRSKVAMDNRAKFDKYSLMHYFDEELRSAENSIWWDDDSLEHEF